MSSLFCRSCIGLGLMVSALVHGLALSLVLNLEPPVPVSGEEVVTELDLTLFAAPVANEPLASLAEPAVAIRARARARSRARSRANSRARARTRRRPGSRATRGDHPSPSPETQAQAKAKITAKTGEESRTSPENGAPGRPSAAGGPGPTQRPRGNGRGREGRGLLPGASAGGRCLPGGVAARYQTATTLPGGGAPPGRRWDHHPDLRPPGRWTHRPGAGGPVRRGYGA
jgi:hypothetical protein